MIPDLRVSLLTHPLYIHIYMYMYIYISSVYPQYLPIMYPYPLLYQSSMEPRDRLLVADQRALTSLLGLEPIAMRWARRTRWDGFSTPCGKTMEKPWKNYGTTMEQPWNNHGKAAIQWNLSWHFTSNPATSRATNDRDFTSGNSFSQNGDGLSSQGRLNEENEGFKQF